MKIVSLASVISGCKQKIHVKLVHLNVSFHPVNSPNWRKKTVSEIKESVQNFANVEVVLNIIVGDMFMNKITNMDIINRIIR